MKTKLALSLITASVVAATVLGYPYFAELNELFSGKLWFLVGILVMLGFCGAAEFQNRSSYREKNKAVRLPSAAVHVTPEMVRGGRTMRNKMSISKRNKFGTAALWLLGLLLISHNDIHGSTAAASVALEEAVFQAEVLGDPDEALNMLDAVINRRDEVLAEVWAEAVARSAQLHLAKGNREEALRRAGMIKSTARLQRSQWMGWADQFIEANNAPNFHSIPWEVDEYLTYEILSTGNEAFGFSVHWSGVGSFRGESVREQSSWLYIALTNMINGGRLYHRGLEDGMRPLNYKGRVHFSDSYEVTYDWAGNKMDIQNGRNPPSTMPIPSTGIAYDTDQFFFFPRLLNPEETPQLNLVMVIPGGLFGAASFKFKGIEDLEYNREMVRAEKWETELNVKDVSYQRFVIWVQPEQQRRVLKIDSETFKMVLKLVETRPGMQQMTRRITTDPIQYVVPERWTHYEGLETERRNRVMFLSPDGMGFAFWLISRPETPDANIAEIVTEDIRQLSQMLPEYTPLTTDKHLERAIASTPALGARATFTERGRTILEERYYFLLGERVQWIVLRAPQEDWALYADGFNLILDGITKLDDAGDKEPQ